MEAQDLADSSHSRRREVGDAAVSATSSSVGGMRRSVVGLAGHSQVGSPWSYLVGIALLVSCSGNSSDLAESGDVGAATSTLESTNDNAEPFSPTSDGDGGGDEGASTEDDLGSAVANYLGYQVPGYGEVDQSELLVEQQEVIARCMRNQGFNYIAWVEDPASTYVPVDEDLDPESREFAATYGFGVSTQFYSQDDVGPGLVGHSGDGYSMATQLNSWMSSLMNSQQWNGRLQLMLDTSTMSWRSTAVSLKRDTAFTLTESSLRR